VDAIALRLSEPLEQMSPVLDRIDSLAWQTWNRPQCWQVADYQLMSIPPRGKVGRSERRWGADGGDDDKAEMMTTVQPYFETQDGHPTLIHPTVSTLPKQDGAFS
jgi:hypothetical protein